MKLWHVTHIDNLEPIFSEGFEANWGDDGFGVYLFNDLSAAEDYAHNGGWDGSLSTSDAVILEVVTDEALPIEVNPEWPNPEDYEAVYVVFRDESDPFFKPDQVTLVAGAQLPSP